MRKLLIANRGEIARRVMRTARAMGIATVAVHSDADAGAPHVFEADEAVRLPGSSPTDTYLRADLVLDAARRTGADAVHPGYGFLSENAAFAAASADAGLTFVGPTPRAIELMGSKIEAKRLMADAGVPVLGAEGFPLLVKAAFGGGGRGMRIVHTEAELAGAMEAARAEAAAAFGDGTVFVERYVESPRHVEVQVFGDTHGNVVHLFERECSIQRRHQKVIEESPSPALDDARRDELCAAAVAAAKAIGYVNAGTVEFVLAPDGEFFFLEVNTRLQVEHPVTEMVTGLDLVRVQLLVAMGEPLPPEVLDASMHGHAVEARLYAEDVPAGFLPASGPVHRLRIPAGDGLRVDAGYVDGGAVSTHYDAMLAKVIAWAPTRGEAARRLADALDRAELHGVVTNRDLLVNTLRHDEFLAGATDTAFYERHDPAVLGASRTTDETHRVHAHAAAQAERPTLPTPAGIPRGWRNVGPRQQPTTFDVTGLEITVDGSERAIPQHTSVHHVGDTWYVDSPLGHSVLLERARFPLPGRAIAAGSLLAPMPGLVTKVFVAVGDAVTHGQPVVVLEAMKMQHTITAPHDGTVTEVLVGAGAQVEAAAPLVVIE